MFDVAPDGTLIYDGNTGSGNSASPPAGTLFDPDPAPETDVPEESLEDAESLPLDGRIDSPDPDVQVTSYPLTGSGNAVQLPPVIESVDELSVTATGNVYIYPDVPDAEPLAEARSATAANVLGLPNSTSLSYLEDVVAGYPSWYKYMAFKSDANYSQSMVLWIAPQGVKSGSGNRIDFTDVDMVEVAYVRSGTSNYYQYRTAHYDSYSINYDSDVFLYTNVVGGYAHFDSQHSFPTALILFAAFVLAAVLLIFRGGGRS